MIYFENFKKGIPGLNNHLISYILCLSLSNFLERDFYFDHEIPSSTPPDFAIGGKSGARFEILMNSPRSLVSDLLEMPARRVSEIDRDHPNKIRIEDLALCFMTDRAQAEKFWETWIWNYFSLGRAALIKEELQEFEMIEIGESNLVNVSFFYFLNKPAKNALLDSVKIRYTADLENLAAKIAGQIGRFNSLQLRLGDFRTAYAHDRYAVETVKFKKYFAAIFEDKCLPVLIATDGLHEKDLFSELLEGFEYIFIDELIFDDFYRDFRELEFTDFNALTVINQILCAASENFVGTLRSTVTSIIHRLRQERYGKADFNFVPDGRISRLLSPDYRLEQDAQGFFHWNKYSAFSEHYEYPAWMREWDYDLTSI